MKTGTSRMNSSDVLTFYTSRETTITWTKEGNLLITDKTGRIVHHSPSWQFTADRLATMYENGFNVKYAEPLEQLIQRAMMDPKRQATAILIINEATAKFRRLFPDQQ
jgi:hypothetical protein